MIKTFTSDHFETYKKCPKAYYYKYKKKIKFALQKDTYKLGRSIHSLADYHLRGLTLGKIEADLDETTKEHWQNVLKSPLLNKKIICTEWGFDILLGKNIWLNGRIDAVFEASEESPNSTNLRLSQMRPQKCENSTSLGERIALFETGQQSRKQYIIADWKTGESLPYNPEEKYQAMIYMYAFYKAQKDLGLKFEPHQLKFVFVSTKKENLTKEIICSNDMILEIEHNLLGMVEEIEAKIDFEPNKKSCTFCDFAQICSR